MKRHLNIYCHPIMSMGGKYYHIEMGVDGLNTNTICTAKTNHLWSPRKM